jgi:hypothetical protein
MAQNLLIKVGNLEIKAKLNNSKTAAAIYDKLPLEAKVSLWGEEIYFEIPVRLSQEKDFARDIVELGDLGYWPQGRCFCIFFGLTPVSKNNEIKPASSVNIIGKVLGDPKEFKKVKEGEKIILSKDISYGV